MCKQLVKGIYTSAIRMMENSEYMFIELFDRGVYFITRTSWLYLTWFHPKTRRQWLYMIRYKSVRETRFIRAALLTLDIGGARMVQIQSSASPDFTLFSSSTWLDLITPSDPDISNWQSDGGDSKDNSNNIIAFKYYSFISFNYLRWDLRVCRQQLGKVILIHSKYSGVYITDALKMEFTFIFVGCSNHSNWKRGYEVSIHLEKSNLKYFKVSFHVAFNVRFS